MLFALVGSHDSINPRNFRVLVSDGPIPTELIRVNGQTIRQAGLNVFTVLIGENRRVSPQAYNAQLLLPQSLIPLYRRVRNKMKVNHNYQKSLPSQQVLSQRVNIQVLLPRWTSQVMAQVILVTDCKHYHYQVSMVINANMSSS